MPWPHSELVRLSFGYNQKTHHLLFLNWTDAGIWVGELFLMRTGPFNEEYLASLGPLVRAICIPQSLWQTRNTPLHTVQTPPGNVRRDGIGEGWYYLYLESAWLNGYSLTVQAILQNTAEQLETRIRQEDDVKTMMISVHIGSQGNVPKYIHLCVFCTTSQITCIILILFFFYTRLQLQHLLLFWNLLFT